MSTQINVTVGSGGLSDKAKQLQTAARQAQLEKERTAQTEAEATDKRIAAQAAQGLSPDGQPLYSLGFEQPQIVRRPAAFRSGNSHGLTPVGTFTGTVSVLDFPNFTDLRPYSSILGTSSKGSFNWLVTAFGDENYRIKNPSDLLQFSPDNGPNDATFLGFKGIPWVSFLENYYRADVITDTYNFDPSTAEAASLLTTQTGINFNFPAKSSNRFTFEFYFKPPALDVTRLAELETGIEIPSNYIAGSPTNRAHLSFKIGAYKDHARYVQVSSGDPLLGIEPVYELYTPGVDKLVVQWTIGNSNRQTNTDYFVLQKSSLIAEPAQNKWYYLKAEYLAGNLSVRVDNILLGSDAVEIWKPEYVSKPLFALARFTSQSLAFKSFGVDPSYFPNNYTAPIPQNTYDDSVDPTEVKTAYQGFSLSGLFYKL